MAGSIFGIGNPILDISADVESDLLDKYGVQLNNAILAEEKHLPIYQELISSFPVKYIAGGATQNSIRVAQWIMQQPGATSYVGCVGKDEQGAQLRKSAESDNVQVHYAEDEKTPTGTCAVLVKDKERSLIANLAAANNYPIEHFTSDEITPIWQKAKLCYTAGFFLTVSPPTIMHLAKYLHEQDDKVFCMNLSAPFLCEFFKEPMLAALPYVDIIFGNESEAEAFGKANGLEDTSPRAVCIALAALPKENPKRSRIAIVTQGAGDTLVCQDGEVTSYPVPPVEDIVDVNGAGDAFVGGFIASWVQGKDIATCIKVGHYAAGTILKVSGTVLSGVPQIPE